MLNTNMLEKVYEEEMDNWLEVHGGLYMDRCDICREPSTGILYNLPGGDGQELLVCYSCYVELGRSKQLWKES